MRSTCIVAIAIVCLTSLIEARRHRTRREGLESDNFLPERDPSENKLVDGFVKKFGHRLEQMTGLKFNKLEATQYRLGPLMDGGERCVIYLIKIRAMEDGIDGEPDYDHWFHVQLRQNQRGHVEFTEAHQTTEGSPLRPLRVNPKWIPWNTDDE